MARELEADWEQVHLLPPCIEDWIKRDHPARFIREFVEELDLSELGFSLPTGGLEGRPGYSAKLLLRVWLYGYYEKVRSLRNLERACVDQMGFVWLCGGYRPDHNTLWRFWNANRKALRKLFKQTVRVAVDLDLVGFVVQAIDGTKIQSRCSGRGVFNEASLEEMVKKLDRQIEEMEAGLEDAGNEGPQAVLPESLQKKSVLRGRIKEALSQIEQGEARHVHPHDQESRRMGTEGRNRFAYNAQAAVDAKNQIVVAAEVVNDANDTAQLNPMIELAEETTQASSEITLADGGYATGEQIRQAQEKGKSIVTPLPSSSKNPKDNPYHASRFTYDKEHDEVICPQGRRIPFQRERPKNGITLRVYRSAAVCKGCPVRRHCTRDRHGRTIDIAPSREAIEKHRKKMDTPEARQLYEHRARIVEPLFAWIKQQDGMRRWTFFGLENVRTQWAMLCTASNLRTLYKHWSPA